jgi:capsular polysaccharide export protein
VPSRIEQYLNSETRRLTPAECERARKIMTLLREHKITKYNYQPIYTPDALRLPGKKILVADQSLRDASITRGMADEKSFEAMLEAAMTENPDAHIIIKMHPDSISKGRGSYYGKIKERGRIHKLTEAVNPWCVLEAVDKVYVCTSQIGFEALMCGKEVHCFGMPVYAGWGLTKDIMKLERRKIKVYLEKIVYALYVKFAVYIHPEIKNICECEDILHIFGVFNGYYHNKEYS